MLTAFIVLGVTVFGILPHLSIEKFTGFAIGIAVLLIAGVIARLAFWLLSLLPSRFRASFVTVTPLILFSVMHGIGLQRAAILVGILFLVTTLLGGSLAVLWSRGFELRAHRAAVFCFGLGVTIVGVAAIFLFRQGEPPNSTLEGFHLEDRTLDLPDPSAAGPHEVLKLTYGSGQDRKRPDYGSEVGFVSRSVDGSKLIDNWDGIGGWLRTRYWGFDATALPLQARVWYPDGPGPYPLVLIVHGNHGMEDFSDPGYGYLGQLLASRGYIFASVDENFLNGSFADEADVIETGLDEESDARAWLLLEHLALWRDWNGTSDHAFFGKVDLDRIALIGHSRGGEAVAVAAAFNALEQYPDDATLSFDYGFNIRGIIAIAPADGQYEPRGRGTPLRDIDYFVLHGSMDGDVESFMGASQYSRIEFSADDIHFKASAYVQGANHGQFNTSWGRYDMPLPGGWMLDTRRIMGAAQQRRVAETYFSAFLEVVLKGNVSYLPVFADARYAAAWLPDTYYLSQYADSSSQWAANFEEDLNPATPTVSGGRIQGEHLTKWREEWIYLKWNPLDTHALILAWDDDVYEAEANLSITLPPGALTTNRNSALIFSLSAADESTIPNDWEADEDEEEEKDQDEEEQVEPKLLDLTIVLTDAQGESASLPLSHDQPLYPQIKTMTRRVGLLPPYASNEVIFRHYTFALEEFAAVNGAFDSTRIREICFRFDRDPKGAIILDDVGFATDPRALVTNRDSTSDMKQ